MSAKTRPSVRLMAPFSMKCDHCHSFIPRSKKFNARKESTSKDYLGIKIFNFVIRCPKCSERIVFCTDPQRGDYAVVSGAARFRSIEKSDSEQKSEKLSEHETKKDTVKQLEDTTASNIREQERDRELIELMSKAQTRQAERNQLSRTATAHIKPKFTSKDKDKVTAPSISKSKIRRGI